jgi:hypothetical protein
MAGVLSDLILRDWMLPHYALEDATAGEAWSEVWHHMMAEKKQFILYAVLRVVLPFIAIGLRVHGSGHSGDFSRRGGVIAALEYGLHSAFADADRRSGSGRYTAPGLLRSDWIRLLVTGQHLPGRTGEHWNTRVCADLLWRPLPGAGRRAVPFGCAPD